MSEGKERNYLVGILAENHKLSELVGGGFGKPGQKSDLQFYDRLDTQLNAVFCAIDAIGYPDKLKSLIHTMMITEFHVVLIDNEQGITPLVGEMLVALEIYYTKFNSKAFIAIGNINDQNEYKLEDTLKKIKMIIGKMEIKDVPVVTLKNKEDRENLKKIIFDAGKDLPDYSQDVDKTIVLIDHVFPVRGIGTVILGTVKSGLVKASEMLNLVGLNKKVIIRSIQKQDRDFKTAEAGERVGLAIKGIKPEDVDRNMLLSSANLFKIAKKFKVNLKVSPFYKGELSPENARQFTMFINLASTPFKVIGGSTIKPGQSGEIEIEATREIPIPTTGGQGIIVELNKFENKLRIIGQFDIL